MAYATPSPTLFVGNLENKTKKPELRASLYALFTPYGRVIDIVAKKHDGGRGQAFVVFEEQAAATAALRGLSGEPFYDRELRITYARTSSHATLALDDPTFSKEVVAIRAARGVLQAARDEYEQLAADSAKRGAEAGGDDGGRPAKRVKTEAAEDEDDMEIEMEDDDDVTGTAPSSSAAALVCTNLPAECTPEIMSALFSQYPGFVAATAYSGPAPASHPPPNEGARSFRATFASPDQAKAAEAPLKGYLMQPGWEMAVSIEA